MKQRQPAFTLEIIAVKGVQPEQNAGLQQLTAVSGHVQNLVSNRPAVVCAVPGRNKDDPILRRMHAVLLDRLETGIDRELSPEVIQALAEAPRPAKLARILMREPFSRPVLVTVTTSPSVELLLERAGVNPTPIIHFGGVFKFNLQAPHRRRAKLTLVDAKNPPIPRRKIGPPDRELE